MFGHLNRWLFHHLPSLYWQRLATWLLSFKPLEDKYLEIVDLEIANPWKHPRWFVEDAWILTEWTTEDIYDYIYADSLWSSPIFWVGLCVFVLGCIRSSYRGYKALGTGRQPSNVWGWLKTKIIEFIVLRLFRVDVLSKPYCDMITATGSAGLALPERGWAPGTRPVIKGIDPLAQMTGINPFAMDIAGRLFVHYEQRNQDLLEARYVPRSGEFPTLSVRLPPIAAGERRFGTMREWEDLVAQARPDGSMVVYLNPRDAEEVIRKGWGQRNPLAVMHEVSLYRFFYHDILGRSTPFHHGCVIVYAPLDLDEEEAGIVYDRILSAAVVWRSTHPFDWSIQ